jgi:hypothetical protein
MNIEAPISLGELVDRITILEIKLARFPAGEKRQNVDREWTVLTGKLDQVLDEYGAAILAPFKRELEVINVRLWKIEDDIRDCERSRVFDDRFIQLARQVYRTNDERARVKREINEAFGSDLMEEKSYSAY